MRILVDRDGRPLEVELDEDEDEPCHGEQPRGHHQQSVEHEPLVELAASRAGPGLRKRNEFSLFRKRNQLSKC